MHPLTTPKHTPKTILLRSVPSCLLLTFLPPLLVLSLLPLLLRATLSSLLLFQPFQKSKRDRIGNIKAPCCSLFLILLVCDFGYSTSSKFPYSKWRELRIPEFIIWRRKKFYSVLCLYNKWTNCNEMVMMMAINRSQRMFWGNLVFCKYLGERNDSPYFVTEGNLVWFPALWGMARNETGS